MPRFILWIRAQLSGAPPFFEARWGLVVPSVPDLLFPGAGMGVVGATTRCLHQVAPISKNAPHEVTGVVWLGEEGVRKVCVCGGGAQLS